VALLEPLALQVIQAQLVERVMRVTLAPMVLLVLAETLEQQVQLVIQAIQDPRVTLVTLALTVLVVLVVLRVLPAMLAIQDRQAMLVRAAVAVAVAADIIWAERPLVSVLWVLVAVVLRRERVVPVVQPIPQVVLVMQVVQAQLVLRDLLVRVQQMA
jgi:hypothetical protein